MLDFLPFVIMIIGAVVIAVVINFWSYRSKKKHISLGLDFPLKRTGVKILVNLKECEIRSREYYEKEVDESFPTKIDMLDSLYGVKPQEALLKRHVSVILYKHLESDGSYQEFKSAAIYLSGDLLRSRLDRHKETFVYVHPEDKSRYYFDIEFLNI
jgi:hypothetical protein